MPCLTSRLGASLTPKMSEALPSPAPFQRPGWPVIWLAAGLFALPWAYRVEWDTNRVAALIFLPALWSGRALLVRSVTELLRAQRVLAFATLAFVGCLVIATARSAHVPASIVMAAAWVLIALVALLARQALRETPEATAWLAGAMALSGALATALHWYRWRSGGDIQTAFYVYYRLMGLHALSSAFAAVVMVFRTRTAPLPPRLAWLFVGIVAWGGLLWTGSRSPLLGLAAGLGIWLLTLRAERLRLLGCIAVLALSGLAVSYVFFSPDRGIGWWHVWERSAPTQDARSLTSNRSDFWAGALEHIQASPWFGYGPDAYGFLTPPLEGAQPHNVLLQVLLDVGAFGALALGLGAALVLWHAWRRPINDTASPRAWLGLAVAGFVSGQFDGYFFYPLALIPACVALGACAAAIAAAPNEKGLAEARPPLLTRSFLAASALSATAVLAFHCWLFQQVVHRPVPASPTAFVVRAWKVFPTATYNVEFWMRTWEKTFPDDAVAIGRIASDNAQAPAFLRRETAMILARRGEHRAAAAELERAVAQATPQQRPVLEKLLAGARAAAR